MAVRRWLRDVRIDESTYCEQVVPLLNRTVKKVVKQNFIYVSILSASAALLLSACGSEQIATAKEVTEAKEVLPEVAVLTVHSQSVPVRTELPGRVAALRVSEVRPQVSGIIQKRLFAEGSDVKAGDLLYQINPDSYQAKAEQAEADLALEKAALVNLRVIAERYTRLLDSKTVTQQEYELSQANYQQGLARVRLKEAALKTAQIDLQRTQIRAAIAGRIGRSNVTEGALVSADQIASLARIQQLDPIHVDIVQSSQQLTQLRRRLGSGSLKPGLSAVHLVLEDGQAYSEAGTLKLTEMAVDADAGAVTLRSQFANPEKLLIPGMYVRASVAQGVESEVILVPQQAVRYDEKNQASALVVNKQQQVEVRVLELAGSQGNQWIARSGLQSGERVIVEGALKAAPGTKVRPTEWKVAAMPDLADSPARTAKE